MPPGQRLTRTSFHQTYELGDWRVIGHRLIADFRAQSFAGACDFATHVADIADTANHHPDIDIRYPGQLRITLTTHAVDGLTELDAQVAASISAVAATLQVSSTFDQVASIEIAIDALDIASVLPFWRTVMGYLDEPSQSPVGTVDAIRDPKRVGPSIWFQQMDAPRPQRNRVHLDVLVPHDVAVQRVADAIADGGRLVSDDQAQAFWVLADAEGNEVCVCTWQDRD
jgi:4a-hydroxytetrahydrobiopterin dehydratase